MSPHEDCIGDLVPRRRRGRARHDHAGQLLGGTWPRGNPADVRAARHPALLCARCARHVARSGPRREQATVALAASERAPRPRAAPRVPCDRAGRRDLLPRQDQHHHGPRDARARRRRDRIGAQQSPAPGREPRLALAAPSPVRRGRPAGDAEPRRVDVAAGRGPCPWPRDPQSGRSAGAIAAPDGRPHPGRGRPSRRAEGLRYPAAGVRQNRRQASRVAPGDLGRWRAARRARGSARPSGAGRSRAAARRHRAPRPVGRRCQPVRPVLALREFRQRGDGSDGGGAAGPRHRLPLGARRDRAARRRWLAGTARGRCSTCQRTGPADGRRRAARASRRGGAAQRAKVRPRACDGAVGRAGRGPPSGRCWDGRRGRHAAEPRRQVGRAAHAMPPRRRG